MLDGNDDISLNNSCDPDLNLLSEDIKFSLDTTYLLAGKLHNFLDNSVTDWFSILHLHIWSIKKNFENFKLFFPSLEIFFSVALFSEAWLDDLDNLTYELANYIIKHQSFVDTNFKSAIFKTDISDHFPICLFLPSPKAESESETTFIYKRIANTLELERNGNESRP